MGSDSKVLFHKRISSTLPTLESSVNMSITCPSIPEDSTSSPVFSTDPKQTPELQDSPALQSTNVSNSHLTLPPIVMLEQDYQELEQLIKGVDKNRAYDTSDNAFAWVEITTRTTDCAYFQLLFHLLQSCAVLHPNLLRHKDLTYISADISNIRLFLLVEQTTGTTFKSLQTYYTLHPQCFDLSIFWDLAAQLLTAIIAINKYSIGTISPCMWCPHRLTAANVYIMMDGSLKLPQYYAFDTSCNEISLMNKSSRNGNRVLFSLLDEFLRALPCFQHEGEKNILPFINPKDQKAVRAFLKILRDSKDKSLTGLLTYKYISDALELRKSGNAPLYPFQISLDTTTNDFFCSSRISIKNSMDPFEQIQDIANWLSLTSADSSSNSEPLTTQHSSPSISKQPPATCPSPIFLSQQNLTSFRKNNLILDFSKASNKLTWSMTCSESPGSASLGYYFYSDIYSGFQLVKQDNEARNSDIGKISGAPSHKGLSRYRVSRLELIDDKSFQLSDVSSDHSTPRMATQSPNTLLKAKYVSLYLNKKRRIHTLLSVKILDKIRAYYEIKDSSTQDDAYDMREEICPSKLYLTAIRDSRNYDDVDLYIAKNQVFSLLLEINRINQLTDLESRIMSFLKRDIIIRKLLDCYFLGEISEEQSELTTIQKREIYLLFSKLFSYISNDKDLFGLVLKHSQFKVVFTRCIFNADSWLRLPNEKSNESLTFKEILIRKVRKEAFEKFLIEILSKSNANYLLKTILTNDYNKAMQSLLQLQIAAPSIRIGAQLGLFDQPLVELTVDVYVILVQNIVINENNNIIDRAICISENLIACLLQTPVRTKTLSDRACKLAEYLIIILSSNDLERVCFSAYIIDFLALFYTFRLCSAVQLRVGTDTDNQREINEIINSMSELINGVVSSINNNAAALTKSDTIRVRYTLVLILLMLLSLGDVIRIVFGRNAGRMSSMDPSKMLQADLSTYYENHRNSMGDSIYIGLDFPVEWLGDAYISHRNQVKTILKKAYDIIGDNFKSFTRNVSESCALQDVTVIQFLVAKIRIVLVDFLHILETDPAMHIGIDSVRARLRVYIEHDAIKQGSSYPSERVFLVALLRKVIMIAMLSERDQTDSRLCSGNQSSILPAILEENQWAWISENTCKIESAARMFGLSADEVVASLKALSVSKESRKNKN